MQVYRPPTRPILDCDTFTVWLIGLCFVGLIVGVSVGLALHHFKVCSLCMSTPLPVCS
jgi:hypothetical protein